MAVNPSRRQATLYGIPMKTISLITLTFQNSALILIMHYSRIMPLVDGQRYYTSTAVFLNEVIKLALSLTMALYDISSTLPSSSPATALFSKLARAVFTGDSWKLAIPAMLYTLQNSLQYTAVSNLDAATFQVTYQLKILSTAIFSVILLGRTLSVRKWFSLVLLVAGVAIVQIPSGVGAAAPVPTMKELKEGTGFHISRSLDEIVKLAGLTAGHLAKRSATYEGIDEDYARLHPQLNASIGLAAVVIACLLSGFAGVYFEKVLKDPKGDPAAASVWVRNVQLSFYSLWPALFLGVMFKDGEHIARTGFFTGYNWAVWTTIIFQALGGVIVALVVKYADNNAKNFATSISIIVSFLASVWFFDFEITTSYLLGTLVVLVATYLYSSEDSERRSPRPPPIVVADYDKTTNDGEQSYFDIESTEVKPSPIRGEAISTSRPGTPSFERRPNLHKTESEQLRYSKREE